MFLINFSLYCLKTLTKDFIFYNISESGEYDKTVFKLERYRHFCHKQLIETDIQPDFYSK